jgi:exodeoxyribonuclease VII small subunit
MSANKQAAATEPLSYEAALAELESIVQRLDNSEVSVDELAPLVERATVLIQQCKALLASTNSRVAQAIEALQAAAEG